MTTSSSAFRRRGLIAAAAVAALAFTTLLAAPAAARPLEKGTFTDVFSETFDDFCDQAGLTVEVDTVFEGRFLTNQRKPGSTPFFQSTASVERVYSNADGDTVTETVRSIEKDIAITDNGDGTLTVLVLSTGNAAVYGADGKAIARNPGQVRFEVLIDENGEFLEFLGLVKESTGRTDDFCAAVLPTLG